MNSKKPEKYEIKELTSQDYVWRCDECYKYANRSIDECTAYYEPIIAKLNTYGDNYKKDYHDMKDERDFLKQKASVEALAKIVDPLVFYWSHGNLGNSLTLKCTEAELLEKLHNHLTKGE